VPSRPHAAQPALAVPTHIRPTHRDMPALVKPTVMKPINVNRLMLKKWGW
jgi:hypothetical protein